jgi:hypothetical protein
MSKNKVMSLASVVLILTLLSLSIVSCAFAKYAKTACISIPTTHSMFQLVVD